MQQRLNGGIKIARVAEVLQGGGEIGHVAGGMRRGCEPGNGRRRLRYVLRHGGDGARDERCGCCGGRSHDWKRGACGFRSRRWMDTDVDVDWCLLDGNGWMLGRIGARYLVEDLGRSMERSKSARETRAGQDGGGGRERKRDEGGGGV